MHFVADVCRELEMAAEGLQKCNTILMRAFMRKLSQNLFTYSFGPSRRMLIIPSSFQV
jgi:hypothetical protein